MHMQSSIFLAIFGYLLIASEAVCSKFLLADRVKSWRVYVFYIGVLSLFASVFAPFGLHWYGWNILLVSLGSGVALFFYLMLLYQALHRHPASLVYVLSGVISSLGVLLLSRLTALEQFYTAALLGIIALILGGLLIAVKVEEFSLAKDTWLIVAAGFSMAVSLVLLKIAFNHQNFVSGYVYTRLGVVLGTASIFIMPSFRKEIKDLFATRRHEKKNNDLKNFLAVTGAKTVSAIGMMLITFAIYSGSVTVVNALVATQYLFIFLLSVLLSLRFKQIFQEDLSRRSLIMKVSGIVFVMTGVVLIA
jgi:drug/metabolite transporter (DMT)-like permease